MASDINIFFLLLGGSEMEVPIATYIYIYFGFKLFEKNYFQWNNWSQIIKSCNKTAF